MDASLFALTNIGTPFPEGDRTRPGGVMAFCDRPRALRWVCVTTARRLGADPLGRWSRDFPQNIWQSLRHGLPGNSRVRVVLYQKRSGWPCGHGTAGQDAVTADPVPCPRWETVPVPAMQLSAIVKAKHNSDYSSAKPIFLSMIEQQQQFHPLDQYVAPGLRLWMLIGLVSSVLLVMVVIVCCFVRIRIPRTKRQIELRAAKRRKRRALRESGGADCGESQEGEHNQYRGAQTIVLNSFTGASGGGGGLRRSGNGAVAGERQASRSIPV
uniref:Uncharacterized protein n=1 Tax=Globodera rostochiensis TaxID=31243 RepID=A0A914HX99_GLORO